MRRIDTLDDVKAGLEALTALEPRLTHVAAVAGTVPLRRHAPGFESLAGIIVSQQISKSAADAIFARLKGSVAPLTPEAMLLAGETGLAAAGLSRPKQKTLLAVAEACCAGLDLGALCACPADEAVASMTAVRGIGPWTAEVYLLFCAGHPDIFPAGDIALQNAVRHAFALDARPGPRPLAAMAERWSPHRSVAARLFWAYYANMKGSGGAPL